MKNALRLSATFLACFWLCLTHATAQNTTNAIADYNLTTTLISKSVNAHTVIGNPRTALYANPDLNAVIYVRRGGPLDPGGISGNKGNKVYFDLSTDGGSTWQAAKGKLHDDDDYQSQIQPPNATYGGRMPLGLIWNPPGNTNINNAFVASCIPTLTHPVHSWGALAYTLSSVSSPTAQHKYILNDTSNLRHVSASMAVNAAGHIFHVELDHSFKLVDGLTQLKPTGKILLTKLIVNPQTVNMTHEIKVITLPGNPNHPSYKIFNPRINFAPNGEIGYISFIAYLGDPTIQRRPIYYPFVMKTTDGGESWSEPFTTSLSYSPNFINMRNAMMGDSVTFIDESFPNITYKEKVLYSLYFEHYATVDIHGDLHFLSTAIATVDDSGKATLPVITNLDHIRIIDLHFRHINNTFHYAIIGATNTLTGILPGWPSFNMHYQRPQLSRNKAGTKIFYSYFATDTSSHPAASPLLPFQHNDFPDLYLAGMDVSSQTGYRFMKTRNVTKGTILDGQMYYATVSPFVLEQNENLLNLPITIIKSYGAPTDSVDHLYVGGVQVNTLTDSIFIHDPIVFDNFPTQTQKPKAQMTRISLFPNPATNRLHIQHLPAFHKAGTYQIYNVFGQTVLRGLLDSGTNTAINIASLKAGLYTISIQLEGNTVSKKFLKE
jgi:hypothetical protein